METFQLASFLLTASFVSAQVTSPRGFDNIEGNTIFSHWAGSRRFQQIDFTQTGPPMAITSIAWRRDGDHTNTGGPRTFDFELGLGHTDFAFISHAPDANFHAGTRTTVLSQTAVAFPDWDAPLPGPTPFDFRVSLPVPFYYNGIDALVIDFTYTNNSATIPCWSDREYTGNATPTQGVSVGIGCVATGNDDVFRHTGYTANHGNRPMDRYGLRLRLAGTNAPRTSGVFAMLDATNFNLTGVLCSTLYTRPNILVPMQTSGTDVVDLNMQFPYVPGLVGASLYSQLGAYDPGRAGIPVIVSNAVLLTVPNAQFPDAHRCSYGYQNLPSAKGVMTHFIGGGMVMQLQ